MDKILRLLLILLGSATTFAIYDLSKSGHDWNVGLIFIASLAFILAVVFPNLKNITAKFGIDGGEVRIVNNVMLNKEKEDLLIPPREINPSYVKLGLIVIVFIAFGATFIAIPSIQSLTLKLWKDGPEFKLERHKTSAPERKKIIEIAQEVDKKVEIADDKKKLIENAKKRSNEERSPEDYLILAAQAWRSKEYDKALDYGYAGLRLTPVNTRVKASLLSQVGATYFDLKNESLASQYYNEAIKIDPLFSASHYALGNLYLEHKKYAEAEKEYRKAIELEPENAYALFNYGNFYSAQKKYKEAEIKYKEAIRLFPEFAEAYSNLGNLYDDQNNYEEAEKNLIKGTQLNPGLAISHSNLGKFYGKQNRYNEAEKEFKKAIELKPDFAGAHNNLGYLYFNQKKYDVAEKELKEAIRLKPDLAEALNNLELLLKEKKEMGK